MNSIISSIKKFRSYILIIGILSLIWFFYAIFFIDNRWWWFLIELLALSGSLFYFYNDELNKQPVKELIHILLGWVVIFSFAFIIICAIFIIAWWFFGILIPIIMFIVYKYLGPKNEQEYLDSLGNSSITKKTKKIVLIIISSIFFVAFCLFCIPSFAANNHHNPKEGFSSSYTAVNSYIIYGQGDGDKEHIVPRSWYTDVLSHYENDYVNVIKSNKKANNYRGNLEFGKVKKSEQTSIYDGVILVGYRNSEYFMPTDEYKGDVARILLYMYVTYKDDGLPTNQINVSLMKSWSKRDPVDEFEKARNNIILHSYGYRNKFVTTPWLVGFIV